MRTVEWDSNTQQLQMIDQRLLPSELKIVTYENYHEVADAIRKMVVRGAPAIGSAAAFGLALAAQNSPAKNVEELRSDLDQAAETLKKARPTAANLNWALKKVMQTTSQVEHAAGLREAVLVEAQRIADQDVEINKQMARIGSQLIEDGDTVIHHCNTGALATVDWGTALGVIRMAHEQGKSIHVLVDETRPRLQGARLTSWELSRYRIPHEIISDNAAGFFLRSGQVQKVLFGADRVAANGDVANKIGTYMLSLAAHDNGVPTYSVVPTSTIDLSLPSGDHIPIEERSPKEVLELNLMGKPATPEGAKARNPAFDITPYRLITGIVTENGVVYPPYQKNLHKAVKGSQT